MALSSCSGSFIDPGRAEVTGIGNGGGGFDDDDDHGNSSGNSSGGNSGSGSKATTYTVSWNDYSAYGFSTSLEIAFDGSLTGDQRQKIADAIKLTDIQMSPADVIRLDAVSQGTTRDYYRVECTALKSGTVKITLKSIAGFTFTKYKLGF